MILVAASTCCDAEAEEISDVLLSISLFLSLYSTYGLYAGCSFHSTTTIVRGYHQELVVPPWRPQGADRCAPVDDHNQGCNHHDEDFRFINYTNQLQDTVTWNGNHMLRSRST